MEGGQLIISNARGRHCVGSGGSGRSARSVYRKQLIHVTGRENIAENTGILLMSIGSTVLASVDTCFLYLRVCKLVCAYASMSLDKR